MNIQSFAGRFPIGVRIGVGFSMILAVLLSLAWFGYRTATESRADFVKYVSIGSNAVRVMGIDAAFIEMRRQVRLYADEGEAKALDRVRELRGRISSELDAAIQATGNQERKSNLGKMGSDIKGYMGGVEELVALSLSELIDGGR